MGKEIVAFYNVSEGLTFATEEMRQSSSPSGVAQRGVCRRVEAGPKQASVVLGLLETALKAPKASIAVVIDYLEAVAPAGQISFLSAEDRQNVTTLQRWASNQYLLEQSDTIVILIAAKLGDVHENLRSAPQIDLQQIPRPDHEERLAYLRYLVERQGATVSPEMPLERLAGLTAGLNRQNPYIFTGWHGASPGRSTMSWCAIRKGDFQDESAASWRWWSQARPDSIGGLVYQGGLMKIARYMREGDTWRVPMALAFGGPRNGKTAVAFAFAKESASTA